MCARYTLRTSASALQNLFELEEPPEFDVRDHAAPTDTMPVVRLEKDGKRHVHHMRWGLIPHWAKDITIARSTFNARCETVFEKPTFRDAALRRRCLVPADGFIEWKDVETQSFAEPSLFDEPIEPKKPKVKPKKQPFHIHLKQGDLFAFAGLYEKWNAPSGELVETYTILTCEPNDLMAEIHNRMPVILHEEDFGIWLDRDTQDPAPLLPLLVPFEASAMEAEPI